MKQLSSWTLLVVIGEFHFSTVILFYFIEKHEELYDVIVLRFQLTNAKVTVCELTSASEQNRLPCFLESRWKGENFTTTVPFTLA